MNGFDTDNSSEQGAGLDRRTFLGALGIGLGVSAISLVNLEKASAAETTPTAGTSASSGSGKKAILYDSSKCVGCHYCEGGCKNTNDLPAKVIYNIKALPESVLPKVMIPPEMAKALDAVEPVLADDRDAGRWLRVTEKAIDLGGGKTENIFVRHSCTHCGLCAQVCPASALKQRADGIVTVDSSRCIGCKYCYQACPFDIPRYRTEGPDKAIQKCAMCVQRIDAGQEPACVRDCPTGALTFGSRADMVAAGQKAVASLVSAGNKDAYLYGEKQLGGIGVMSVLRYSANTYKLPKI